MTSPVSDRLDSYFAHLGANNPPSLRLWISDDDPAFCAAAEDAVAYAIVQIEAGARLRSRFNELELSLLLNQLLTAASIPATAEPYHNGHVDVLIRHPRDLPFAMLGECKLYASFSRHSAGCKQLLDRYSSGRSSRGFCLEFFVTPAMYQHLQALRERFDAEKPHRQLGPARDHVFKGAFVTTHEHFTSAHVEVLHLGCNVYHPEAPSTDPSKKRPRGTEPRKRRR